MAGPILTVNLSHNGEEFQNLADKLGATDDQIDKALGSTLNRMSKWMLTQSVRGLSSTLRIQQKILRRRLKTFRMQGTSGRRQAKVWYGLNDIDFADLNPRKRPGGVSTDGGYYMPDAFIGRSKRSGRVKVFKRRTDKPHPLEVVAAEVSEPAMEHIEFRIVNGAEFDAKFFEIFTRELKWRTSSTT